MQEVNGVHGEHEWIYNVIARVHEKPSVVEIHISVDHAPLHKLATYITIKAQPRQAIGSYKWLFLGLLWSAETNNIANLKQARRGPNVAYSARMHHFPLSITSATGRNPSRQWQRYQLLMPQWSQRTRNAMWRREHRVDFLSTYTDDSNKFTPVPILLSQMVESLTEILKVVRENILTASNNSNKGF